MVVRGRTTRLIRGRSAVTAALEPDGAANGGYEGLRLAAAAPLVAGGRWLAAWSRCFAAYEPQVLLVEEDGRPVAAAALASRRRGPLYDVVAVGHGPSDQARLPAVDDDAADRLAAGLADLVGDLPPPWRLRLDQLPVDDPVARRLADLLPLARIEPGDPSPTLPLRPGQPAADHLGRSTRKVAQQMRNRAAREGMAIAVRHLSRPAEIGPVLDDAAAVRRRRDVALVRRSDLDDPPYAAFWRQVVLGLAADGAAELTTVRIGDRLAAYLVALLDGPAHRIWDLRMEPEFARFSPGQLAVQAALERALQRGCAELDFMRGDEPYKRRFTDVVVPAARLLAWSSDPVRLAVQAPQAVRGRAREAADRYPVLRRGWRELKRRTLPAEATKVTVTAPTGTSNEVRVIALSDVDSLLSERWRELGAGALEPNPFHDADFALAAHRYVDSDREVSVLLVERGGRLRLALPLRQLRFRGIPVPALTTWHHDYRFLGTPLLDPDGAQETVAAAVSWLHTRPLAPWLVLDQVPVDGPVAQLLQAAFARQGMRPVTMQVWDRPVLHRRREPDYLAETFGSTQRKKQRRKERRLAEQLGGPVQIFDAATAGGGAFSWAVESFLDIENAGWKGRQGGAFAARPGHADFFREVCIRFQQRGMLQLYSLGDRSTMVAGHCCFVARDTVFRFKPAYDERYARCSPGVALEVAMIEAFHDDHRLQLIESCTEPVPSLPGQLFPDRRRMGTLLVPLRHSARALVHTVPPALAVWRRARGRSPYGGLRPRTG